MPFATARASRLMVPYYKATSRIVKGSDMSFIQGVNRNQLLMFPESLNEYIGEDNPVRSEMSLTVLAYNIKRVINVLGLQNMVAALA